MGNRRIYRLHVTSNLRASAAEVWAHASSMRGINEELAPIRMSHPAGARLSDDVPLGRFLFRSWITLWGVIPLDLHDLALRSFEPGRGFHEDSRTLIEARWVHKRTVEAAPGGSRVDDDVTFEPKLFGPVIAQVARWVFARRHARLRAKFGSAESGDVRVDDVAPARFEPSDAPHPGG